MQRTLYEVLGVSTKATAVEVKAAYKRKVLVHHPDVQQQGGAADEFLACRHAYEILTDPHQRSQYDQGLRAVAQGKVNVAPAATPAGTAPRRRSPSPGLPACMAAASAATTVPLTRNALNVATGGAAAVVGPAVGREDTEGRSGAAGPGNCSSMADLRAVLLQECGAVMEDFASVQEALGALPWDDPRYSWYSAPTPGPDSSKAQQQVPWAGADHAQLWNWLQEQQQQQQQQPP